MPKGLTVKFLFYFLVISILPLAGVSYLAFLNGRDAIVRGTTDNLASTLVLRQAEIDRWLSDTLLDFQDIGEKADLGELFAAELRYHKDLSIQGSKEEHERIHTELRAHLQAVGALATLNFFEIFLLSPEGEVHVSTNPDQETKQKEDRLYFQQGLKQITIQPFYYSVTLGEPAVTISNPIKNKSGIVVGVLAGRLRLDRISRIMEERTGLGESGETYLVNSFYFLMTKTRYGYSMKQGIFTQSVEDCLGKKHPWWGLYENYKGASVISAYHWIDKYNVCMIAEISQEEAFKSIRRFGGATFLFGFLAIFFASIFGVFVAHSVIKPIGALKKGVSAIGLGNLEYEFSHDMKDEFADLAAEFDNMRLQLKEIRSREQALSQLKSEFVSVAAHQLHTPLSGIKWALSMLLDGDVGNISAEQKDFTAKLYESNERMIHLVNDLLNVARLEEGRFDYHDAMVDLEMLVGNIVEQKKLIADHKKVSLTIVKESKVIPLIFADEGKISIAIANLVDNALKYTKSGGTVSVRLSCDKKNIHVSVEDTGIGIPESQKPKLFIKFFRGMQASEMDREGSGLGLYISKNIAEHYKGMIEVKSEEGKGSVFTFTIPGMRNKKG